jgi:hypothetical protein
MRSGTDVSKVENQSQVRERFGTPDSSSEDERGGIDVYRTRRKIDEEFRATTSGELWAMMFGTLEFLAFPEELYRLGRGTLLGQELRFSYDSSGKVTDIDLDGEPVVFSLFVARASKGNQP